MPSLTSRLRSLAEIHRRLAPCSRLASQRSWNAPGQFSAPRRASRTRAFVAAFRRLVVASTLGLFVFPIGVDVAPVDLVPAPAASTAQAQTPTASQAATRDAVAPDAQNDDAQNDDAQNDDAQNDDAKKDDVKKDDVKKDDKKGGSKKGGAKKDDLKKSETKKADGRKAGARGGAAAAGEADPFQANVIPLVRKYCFECHGEKKQEAEVALHEFSDEAAAQGARATWEKVLELVEGQTMPPAERPQPTAAERRQLVRWLEHTLFDLDCTQEHDPGRVTIRRLNRVEYNNTVRDLLGVSFRPADDFPSDDVGHGFDNIGDVLSVSPLLVEKYLNAAEKIASAAVARTVVAKPAKIRRQGKELEDADGAKLTLFGVHSITSRGTVTGKFDISRDGDYIVRVRAAGQQAGPELPKMEIQVDDKSVRTFDVSAIPDKPADHDLRLRLTQGSRKIAATFINDFYDPQAADPKQRDRNLFVGAIEIEGPLDAPPSGDAVGGGLRIVRPSDVKASRDAMREAARETLAPIVRRAFRRNVTDDEVRRYVRLVSTAVERSESYDRGIELGLTAILVAPEFLFRFEKDPDPNDPNKLHAISDFELATRLSYFLWSTMPDDELLDLAAADKLRETDTLKAQLRRMLASPKSRALSENFAAQWLNLRTLEELNPDAKTFPGFTTALKGDLRRETEMLFDAIVRDDRSILELLDADYTFVNERLAKFYGLTGVAGDEFRRVSLTGTQRAGVLTHGSILTLTSNPTRTSPVKRGKWIMENILGTPPPEPPANAPELAATQKAQPDATLRQQLEIHRRDPNCAVCHTTMDQLGFGFENFDAIGRWRDKDAGQPVDSSGILPGGAKFSGPKELIGVLKNKKAEFSRTLTERLLTYALGRGLEFYDRCTVDDVTTDLSKGDYRFSALVEGIVLSEPFRMRRGEGRKP